MAEGLEESPSWARELRASILPTWARTLGQGMEEHGRWLGNDREQRQNHKRYREEVEILEVYLNWHRNTMGSHNE